MKAFKKVFLGLLFFYTLSGSSALLSAPYTAIIRSPVVDMEINYPLSDNPPASSDTSSCLRAHQGLCNELVTCIEERDGALCVSVPYVIYDVDQETQERRSTFWAPKENFVLRKKLSRVLQRALPHTNYGQGPTISLTYPWNGYSLGTRFRHIPSRDTDRSYGALCIDYEGNKVQNVAIPRDCGLIEQKKSAQEARELFVTLINDLVDRVQSTGDDSVIPYIWGGSSFVHTYTQSNFYREDGVWHRPEKRKLYYGYDCSEFVMRMAQIAGLHFPWKTTRMIERFKQPLERGDTLEEGDLIWIPGHVMIISNIAHNEIIEARGYGTGYGCVHRLKIEQCFEGIRNYDQLIEQYFAQKELLLLDRAGRPSARTYPFKILKIS